MAADYASLLPHCETDRQRQVVAALIQEGSVRKAANAVGIAHRNVCYMLERIRLNATRPKQVLTGTSTLIKGGPEDDFLLQWVKERPESKNLASIREAIASVADQYTGTAKAIPSPARGVEDLLTVYPMGDPHIGLYSWGRECGEDFDTSIARNDLLAAVSRLVAVAPASDQAVIANLGDFYHADGVMNTTTKGTRQDVDTRWPRVLEVGFLLMIDLIELALKKHRHVEVINAIGNHDEHSSMALAAILRAWFRNEPRVTVRETINWFHYIEFGKVLLGITHGELIKPMQLGEVMAADMPEAWGRTLYRHWLTGHIHSKTAHEMRGATQESFRTLAAKESWHSRMGYRSGRDMQAIVYDREYGEIERYRCDIRLARRAA